MDALTTRSLRTTDAELWAAARAGDGDCFATFYKRNFELVVAYFRRRVDDPEVAVDLAAEVFAVALRFVTATTSPLPEEPTAWVFGVARNKLIDAYKRGHAETAAREALKVEPLLLDDADLARIDQLASESAVLQLVAELPADQRDAVLARVVEEHSYEEIGQRLGCSQLVARKRVSRGLKRLRQAIRGGV